MFDKVVERVGYLLVDPAYGDGSGVGLICFRAVDRKRIKKLWMSRSGFHTSTTNVKS